MITHIVSDMGGVLIEVQWQSRVEKLLNRPLPIDELHHLKVGLMCPLNQCGMGLVWDGAPYHCPHIVREAAQALDIGAYL